jgi:hypothetical protein
MIVTYGAGIVENDPYLFTKKIKLSHPSTNVQLLITEIESYNGNPNEFLSAEGRTIGGGLQIVGGTYPPPKQIVISCTLTLLQKNAFDILKRFQDYSKIPITIADEFEPIQYIPTLMIPPNWLAGHPTTNALGFHEGYAAFLVWVDIDGNYATIDGDAYKVQFSAKQT